MKKLMVLVSNEGTSETHRWVDFPKLYCFIVQKFKISQKKVKVGWVYILQLSTVYLSFLKIYPSYICREANKATLAMRRTLKVLINNVRELYITFLDILKSNF